MKFNSANRMVIINTRTKNSQSYCIGTISGVNIDLVHLVSAYQNTAPPSEPPINHLSGL